MYNHFPTIKLEETIQNRPSTTESSTDFIVGCVVISPYYKSDEDKVQLVRSQLRLSELFTNEDNPLSANSDITLLNAYRLVNKCALLIMHSSGEGLIDDVDDLYDDEYNVVHLWSDLGHPIIRDEFKKLVEENNGWLLSEDKTIELRTPRQAILSYESPESDITKDGQSQVVALSPFGIDSKTCAFSFDLSPSVMYIETLLNNISEGHDYAGIYSYNYGRVTDISSLKIQYRRCDREELFRLGYNCIYLNKNKGQYFFASNRTTGAQGNTTDKESTRRLANDINYDLFVLGENYIGRNASTLLLEEITSDVKIMMSKYENAKEPIAGCTITCDLSNNTMNDLANGKINLEVAVQVNQQTDNILIFTKYIVTNED